MEKTIEVDIVEYPEGDDGEVCRVLPTGNEATCGPALFAGWKRDLLEYGFLTLVVRNCRVAWDLAEAELEGYAMWYAMKACNSSRTVEMNARMGWYDSCVSNKQAKETEK